MIPYWDIPPLQLPFDQKLDLFGVFSTAGVVVGAYLAMYAARRYGPGDDGPLRDVAPAAILCGLVGGHLLHVLGYHPELLRADDPFLLLRVWDGLSSMGGVLGALAGIFWWFRREKLDLYPYWNALALGTAPGWAVARIGCFFVHDHPGVRTTFPLAVAYPGGPRHDLGLYDIFVLAGLAALLWWMARKPRAPGLLMGVLACGYSVFRFALDFLRASDLGFVDKRYFGLTPAQYIVVGLFALGARMIWRGLRQAPPAAAVTNGGKR